MSYCCQCDKLHTAYWGSCCSRECKSNRDAKVTAGRVIADANELENRERQRGYQKNSLLRKETEENDNQSGNCSEVLL